MALTPIAALPNAKVWYLVAMLATGVEESSAPMSESECRGREAHQQWLITIGGAFRIVEGVHWSVVDIECRARGSDEIVSP